MKTYIFGYGSLLSSESRKMNTTELSDPIPAEIDGFIRGWFARTKVTSLSTTYLGLVQSDQSYFACSKCKVTGILYEVDPSELYSLDSREKNYERIEVPPDSILILDSSIIEDFQVFVYVNVFQSKDEFINSLPSKMYPIVQSYLDICLTGCLEIEKNYDIEGFTNSFLEGITHWSEWWANDRIYPRRAHQYQKHANLFDSILLTNPQTREYFNQIYIE